MPKTIDLRRFNNNGKDAFVTIIRTKAPNILDLVDGILNAWRIKRSRLPKIVQSTVTTRAL